MTWQQVVEAYLIAYTEEIRHSREYTKNGDRIQFLSEHATESLVDAFRSRIEKNLAKLQSPIPSPDWIMVSNTDSKVVIEIPAQVSRRKVQHAPFVSTRIELTKTDAHWKISAVHEECMGCRAFTNVSPGTCYICKGKGKLVPTMDEVCKSCNGTGQCQKCGGGDLSGWTVASYLDFTNVAI